MIPRNLFRHGYHNPYGDTVHDFPWTMINIEIQTDNIMESEDQKTIDRYIQENLLRIHDELKRMMIPMKRTDVDQGLD